MKMLPDILLELAEYPTQKALADDLPVSYTHVRRVFSEGELSPDALHRWTQAIHKARGVSITIGLWSDGEVTLTREDDCSAS